MRVVVRGLVRAAARHPHRVVASRVELAVQHDGRRERLLQFLDGILHAVALDVQRAAGRGRAGHHAEAARIGAVGDAWGYRRRHGGGGGRSVVARERLDVVS